MDILELACKLLEQLSINRIFVYKDHLEIRKEFENQAIIAYGKTENEVIENFYYLYQELVNPA